MIFRVHTLKVPEIGPGFNSTSPHRRMRQIVGLEYFLPNKARARRSEEKCQRNRVKMSKLISGCSRFRCTRRENAVGCR